MTTARSFSSPLGSAIRSYLALKQALGRDFALETDVLAHLDRFLVAHPVDASALTAERFAAWILTLAHLTPTVRRNRMRIVRNLCLYRQRSDPSCFVPDPSTFPAPHARRPPHIFTEPQIVQLLRSAASLRPQGNSPVCAEVFRLAVVLLYTAGLRRGELVRLVLSDYDSAERALRVRASKFHKSRVVALSGDAAREVERYLRARRHLPHDGDAPLLVCGAAGRRGYSGPSFGHSLRRLFRRAEVRTAAGRLPRVHDLRHTYAVHRLLRWY
ncbi:MAG: tyrosine-type recombinase/integrase, partial [Gemmatimonadales bacterium]